MRTSFFTGIPIGAIWLALLTGNLACDRPTPPIAPPEIIATPHALPSASLAQNPSLRALRAEPEAAPMEPGATPGEDPGKPPLAPGDCHHDSVTGELVIRIALGDTWQAYRYWSGIEVAELKNRVVQEGRRAPRLRAGEQLRLRLSHEEQVRFLRMQREHRARQEEEFFSQHNIIAIRNYVVREGDSLRSLAARFGNVPVWLMERLNAQLGGSTLQTGNIINVPIVHHNDPADGSELQERRQIMRDQSWRRLEDGAPLPRPSHLRPVPIVTSALQPPPIPVIESRPPAAVVNNWYCDPPVLETRRSWFSDGAAMHETAPSAPRRSEPLRLRVMRGETLSHYARWSGLPVAEIAAANRVVDPSSVRLDQTIVIPLPESRLLSFMDARNAFHAERATPALRPRATRPPVSVPAPPMRTHVVRSGESAWNIAVQRYSIRMHELAAANPGVRLDNLRPGQRLQIPTR